MRRSASRRRITRTLGAAFWLAGSIAFAGDRLFSLGGERLLIAADGSAYRFRPLPAAPPEQGAMVRFRTGDGRFDLLGADGRYRLIDADGRVRELHLTSDAAGETTHAAAGECPADCEARLPPPADFDRTPSSIGAARIDVRPASCRSYFIDYSPIERGARLEIALGEHALFSAFSPAVRSFPSIDLIGRTEMIVLRSLDLAAHGVGDTGEPDALRDELLDDVERLDRAVLAPLRDGRTLEVHDGVDVTRLDPGRAPVYTLVVRHGVMTERQAAQIRSVRVEMARRFGVRLDVIEVP